MPPGSGERHGFLGKRVPSNYAVRGYYTRLLPRIKGATRVIPGTLKVEVSAGFGRDERGVEARPNNLGHLLVAQDSGLTDKFQFFREVSLQHRRVVGVDAELYAVIHERA